MQNSTPSTTELFANYVVPTYGRFGLCLARGSGREVWDEAGKRYLDFGSGIAVTSVGHAHPRVAAVLSQQLDSLVHTSNLYYTRPQGELAERLVRLIGLPGKIFFCNSGAEANEALYKLSRKHGHETGVGGRHGIVTLLDSFHGRTLAGIAATGQEKVKHGFAPLTPGFRYGDYPALNDLPALTAALAKPEVGALLMEPVQGESGIRPATTEYLRAARRLTRERNQLLMLDEVQCGLGRTGHWGGWRAIADDVEPDAVSWAKGIGGGLPLGAVWISARPVTLPNGSTKPLCDLLGPGSHGTTFGGTPLVCAGATEVLKIVEEENLLENAANLGAYAKTVLAAIGSPLIQDVRGVGLLIAFELVADFAQRAGCGEKLPSLFLVERLHEAGLICIPSGAQSIRWLPALNVTRAEITEAASILARTLASLTA